jgi:hypothetical protein
MFYSAYMSFIQFGLVIDLKGKRPLGRPRRRWEDDIRVDLREIGWGGGV